MNLPFGVCHVQPYEALIKIISFTFGVIFTYPKEFIFSKTCINFDAASHFTVPLDLASESSIASESSNLPMLNAV